MIFTMLQTTLNYVNNITFIINGILTARQKKLHPTVQLLCGISSAFFGGIFLRDLILLHLIPAVFDSPLEFVVTVFIGVFTVFMLKSKTPDKRLRFLLHIADLVGTAAFASAGYKRGVLAGAPWWTCFTSGFVTACGGGLIAAAIRTAFSKDPLHFIHTLKANRNYYLYAALISAAQGIPGQWVTFIQSKGQI